MIRARMLVAALTASIGVSGCIGIVEDGPLGPSGAPRPGDRPDRPSEPVPTCADGDELGPRLLRRLDGNELDTTIRSVFALDRAAWTGPTTPPDAASADGFSNDAERLRVNETYASRLLDTARDVASIVTREPFVSRLAPCASTGDEACARTYVETIGRRLYRRRLEDQELARYLDAYRRIAPSAGFATWMRVATIALVQSPHVVWRSEIGTSDGGTARLASWEIASALAYTYTGAPPDDALMDLAERGELDDPASVSAVARSLALDEAGHVRPAFRAVALRFFDRWLGLSALPNTSKDPVLYPEFSPAVRDSMRREIDAYLEGVALGGGGVAELLTSPTTYVDATLASYYRIGSASGSEMIIAERPEGRGIGLFAQGAWLSIMSNAQITSPTRRGHFVRSRLLCQEIPPPPPTVGPLPEVEVGSVSTRERYEMLHASRADCAACHAQMDPIGFTLEHLDAAGRWRDVEGRFEIDDSGELVGVSRGDLELDGAEDLAVALAELPEVEGCVASWVARSTFGIERGEAACLGASARPALAGESASFVEHWIALAGTEHFTRRSEPISDSP